MQNKKSIEKAINDKVKTTQIKQTKTDDRAVQDEYVLRNKKKHQFFRLLKYFKPYLLILILNVHILSL